MKDLMKKLKSDITFSPDDGAFRSKLVEIVTDNADGEGAELFSERNCDISVSVSMHSLEEGMIRFLCVSDLGQQALDCDLSDLNREELMDLEAQIARRSELQVPALADAAPTVFRKNINGMLDIHQASQKLGCSQTVLKSRIPCTDYTYREIDGKKEIEEYFWSSKLIDRLCRIKLDGVDPEDEKYIAEECCYGDSKWAQEILASLARPNLAPEANPASPKGMKNRSAKIVSSKRTFPQSTRKKRP